MSLHRENVIWKSPTDGLWRRGFYNYREVGDPFSEDFDPEWDVEYDYSSFFWTSDPCTTRDQADQSWTGPNPGCVEIATDREDIAELDRFWRMHRDPKYAAQQTKARHREFIDAEQAKVYESGVIDHLRPGARVDVRVADKTNPGQSPCGYMGTLELEKDWLVLTAGAKTVKVFNQHTGKLYRHGWNATTHVRVFG